MNRVCITGRLTKDPELTKSQNGISVCRFTVAVDRNVKKDEQNPNQQTADFITCVAWRQSAEFVSKYAEKGSLAEIDGHIKTGSYTNKDGNKVYTTDVEVDRVELPRTTKTSRSDAPHGGQSMYTNAGLDTGAEQVVSSDDLPF